MAHISLKKTKRFPCLTIHDLLALSTEEKHGKPNYGAVLHYHRVQMGWSVADVAASYSKALKRDTADDNDDQITASWIYMMENQNMVPVDEKRRWILAQLLNISPLVFGLKTLKDVPEQDVTIFSTLQWEHVDIVEYGATLQKYNKSLNTGSLHKVIPDIQQRINNLNNEIPSKRSSEKRTMLSLLCEYYIVLALIAHNHKQFEIAIHLFSHVILISENNKLYDTWAYALRQRGVAYNDRGKVTFGLVDFAAAKPDFDRAVVDFDTIKAFETHLSPQRKAWTLLASGDIYGHMARDQQELNTALKLVDLGGKHVGDGGDILLDKERYYLDKGMTFIASPFIRFPKDARRYFDLATEHTTAHSWSRQVGTAIHQAEAYYFEGLYPMTVTYAEQALQLVQGHANDQHIPKIENLYKRLKESPYGKNQEVAELGVEIMKMQHPDFFL